ncbi:sugar ABC transporter permease [Acidimicrobiia bacterium EGI L10123]|uniref:carbohydrate ABC transporter permease n=1 Tax=Salinilacustrithrix flava TaxID=2957203 RepID=UPI003D7C1E58|nr:sugar ABC transporter permease [Acidimicrobiia bacterium EGI L10123]
MTAPTTAPPTGGEDPDGTSPDGAGTPRPRGATGAKADAVQQLVVAGVLLGIAVAFWFIDALSDSALMIALTGVVISITASAGIFIGANGIASLLPGNVATKLRPWIFVGPALLFIFVALVVPTARTLYLSILDNAGNDVVGGEQYGWIFTSDDIFGFDGITDMFTSRLFWVGLVALAVGVGLAMRNGKAIGTRTDFSSAGTVLAIAAGVTFVLFSLFTSARGVVWNNLWWVFAVTAIATALGLAVAVLADRVKGEAIAKALIFLPMAISFVGASIIWRFVYAFRPQASDQIGVLNAVWRGLGGAVLDPLQARPWNTFFLIIVLIWGQTGFAMVVLSSAIKAVPDDYIEAARVDGATESQIFWRIILPQIRSTILVVVTTLIILVMKVFDIVKVMTNGEFGTNVIANEMFDQAFRFGNIGRGAALASVLFLAVLPLMYINVRRVREESQL